MELPTDRFLIYALVDPRDDEVRYIGRSSNGLRRPQAHLVPSARRTKSHKIHWINSLAEDGLLPRIEVLENFEEEKELNDAERFWIAQGKGLGWRLTNATKGGEGGLGIIMSAETREKMGVSRRGKRRPPEVGAKVAAALRGRTASEEARANMRAGWKNRAPATEETRAKIAAAHRGKRASAETRARMSAFRKANPMTPEAIEKMRLSKTGKKHAPEHAARISEGLKRAWAKRKAEP